MIIGLHTCNRLEFTKKTVESLIDFNPIVTQYKWIIVDDNSNQDTVDYLENLPLLDKDLILIKDYRAGITVGMKMMMDQAATCHRENILYLQNDWETTRNIDFRSIDSFMLETDVGHIRTIVDKGSEHYHRYASKINLHTREPIKWKAPFGIGKESVVGGNWHYSDIPCFINVDLAACLFEPVDDPTVDEGEGIRVYNAERFNHANYLLMDQPFWNLDWSKKHQTPGGRKK